MTIIIDPTDDTLRLTATWDAFDVDRHIEVQIDIHAGKLKSGESMYGGGT
jgi:hypothetical protein